MKTLGELEVQLVPQDYIAANFLACRTSRKTKINVALLFLGLASLAGLFLYLKHENLFVCTMFGIIGGGGALVWRFIYIRTILPRKLREIFRQQKSLHRPYKIAWDDNSLSASAETAASKYNWADIHKWREGPDLFMVFYSDVMFQMIPKRFFKHDKDPSEFRQFLESKLGPER